jgi:hypothetical protein
MSPAAHPLPQPTTSLPPPSLPRLHFVSAISKSSTLHHPALLTPFSSFPPGSLSMQQRGVLQLRPLDVVLQRLHSPPLCVHFVASSPTSRPLKSRAAQSLGIIINAPLLLPNQISRPIPFLPRARCSQPHTVSTTFTRSLSSGLGSGCGPPFNFNSLKIKVRTIPTTRKPQSFQLHHPPLLNAAPTFSSSPPRP